MTRCSLTGLSTYSSVHFFGTTSEFRAMVVDATLEPGRSVASVAQQFELNANLVHKWRKQRKESTPLDFIRLPAPTNVLDNQSGQPETIRIDLSCGIVVHWPLNHIGDSVSWLKALCA